MSERCDVELLHGPKRDAEPFMARGVRVNGYKLPKVHKAEVIAVADDLTVLRVEMFISSVRDVEEESP